MNYEIVKDSNHVEMQIVCPVCESDRCFLNKEKQVWHCWVCDAKGADTVKEEKVEKVEKTADPKTIQEFAAKIEMGLRGRGKSFYLDRGLNMDSALNISSDDKFIYFPFYRSGKLVNCKTRPISDKKFWMIKDAEKIFFNYQEFANKEYLIITEGEFDCVAVHQMGYENVVSLSNGGNSVKDNFGTHYEWLQQFKQVYLCFDNDDTGLNAINEAKGYLKQYQTRVINLPCKDANEFLNGDFDKTFDYYFQNAESVNNINSIDALELLSTLDEPVDTGFETGWIGLNNKLGGIRMSELTILSGDTGSGKSTFSAALMYNLSNLHRLPIYICSFELKPKKMLRKIASNLLGMELRRTGELSDYQKEAVQEWIQDNRIIKFNQAYGAMDVNALISEIEYHVVVYGVKVVLLDHLHFFLDLSKAKDERTAIDDAVRKLAILAETLNIHIVLVVHPKQVDDKTDRIKMSHMKGSSSIKQDAHNLIIVHRDRKKHTNEVKLYLEKNREFGEEGVIDLLFQSGCEGYTDATEKGFYASKYEHNSDMPF